MHKWQRLAGDDPISDPVKCVYRSGFNSGKIIRCEALVSNPKLLKSPKNLEHSVLKLDYMIGGFVEEVLEWTGLKHRHEDDVGPIDHFVVVCMENRSFDSLLGWWAKHRPGVDGIPDGAHNIHSKTGKVYSVKPNATYIQQFDPEHELDATTCQIYGMDLPTAMGEVSSIAPYSDRDRYEKAAAKMNGFVDHAVWCNENNRNANDNTVTNDLCAAETAVATFDPKDIPITIALAEEFGIFDNWHAGIPGPTFPNRVFLASATSNGMHVNNNEEFAKGLPQTSIFKMFHDKGLNFKNYYGQIPTGLIFSDFRGVVAEDLLTLNPFRHTGNMAEFKKDAEEGNLPAFSWIDPIFASAPGFLANDNHPPHDVARGELLIKEIYEALRASPNWHRTALLITYDEHGGFYDHVPPPTNVPIPDKASSDNQHFRFDRLGLRVPAILVSPRIPRGSVFHNPTEPAPPQFDGFHPSCYDHSSLCKTMNEMFALGANLNDRARWAGSFAKCFSRTVRNDCPLTLPDPPRITEGEERYDEHSEWAPLLDAFKKMF
ncbi:hypothetical protein HDU83_003881 [Entophlyctis luteolus]|nr:hypothetical protein HDU83_003881 [Entophlyctis luteolus]